jgi:hypothetical protein
MAGSMAAARSSNARRAPSGLRFVRRIQDDGRAIVAVTEQHGFRLQYLRPVGIDDVLPVYPVPAPDEQIPGAAFQPRLDRGNDLVAQRQGLMGLTGVLPLLVVTPDERVLRGNQLGAWPLLRVIPDVYRGARRVLRVALFDDSARILEPRPPQSQRSGHRFPTRGGGRRLQHRQLRTARVLQPLRGHGPGGGDQRTSESGSRHRPQGPRLAIGGRDRRGLGRALVQVFAPKGTHPEQERHDDAEKHPSIDQVIDADRVLHSREVTDHDDHVGAQPVRDDRNHDRRGDECHAPRKAPVGKVGVEDANSK